ncbi:MAG TPA: heme exporter protein CcmB [Gemmatimonadaceae bacterium]|nr:heme exporter protein CcmB [Gemmatimonadaceae bacterium]
MSADLVTGDPTDATPSVEHPTGPRFEAPGFVAAALLIARKDMIVELRTRTALLAALALSLLAIVIFNFAWDPTAVAAIDLAPGLLWVIFTFSGLLGLHRAFGVEQADRAMDVLLGAPIPRAAIYTGKALGNLVLVLLVQAISIPAALIVYNVGVAHIILPLAGIAFLAAIGLVAVGTLFGAMTTSTRASELLLPVLALPFFVPVVTTAAQATARVMAGRPGAETLGWLKLLAAYDLIFAVACAAAYTVIADE